MVDQFLRVTKKALSQFLNDRVNDRIKSALQGGQEQEEAPDEPQVDSQPESEESESRGIETTYDELQGYFVVKAIVSQDTSSARIAIRDTKSYCGVLLDDNNRKPICRLYFNGEQKYLGLIDENKGVERVAIESTDDIFQYADQLRETAQRYDKQT